MVLLGRTLEQELERLKSLRATVRDDGMRDGKNWLGRWWASEEKREDLSHAVTSPREATLSPDATACSLGEGCRDL